MVILRFPRNSLPQINKKKKTYKSVVTISLFCPAFSLAYFRFIVNHSKFIVLHSIRLLVTGNTRSYSLGKTA